MSNLYLSFDGVTPRTNPKNHWEVPYTLESARKCGMTVVFVPTVIKSINDHEFGGIIRYAQKNMDVVHAVNFQPVSLTGRMTKKEREKYRILFLIVSSESKNIPMVKSQPMHGFQFPRACL